MIAEKSHYEEEERGRKEPTQDPSFSEWSQTGERVMYVWENVWQRGKTINVTNDNFIRWLQAQDYIKAL